MTAPPFLPTSLRRVDFAQGPWPLHDVAASRALEAAALARNAPGVLMERAGLAVARLALALARPAATFVVLAGPGNNGGDGLVAARHLHRAGQRVQVLLAGDPLRLPTDAAGALAAARAAGVVLADSLPTLPLAAGPFVVDALLGLGQQRAADGAIAELLAWLAARHCPTLAVDLPTGLHADTGATLGAHTVVATHTLSLLTLKPGLFTNAGRDHAGVVWLDDLGESVDAPTACLAGPPQPTARDHSGHKGRYGDVVVVGGAAGMTGAAVLAAEAALAAGAGRVYLSPLGDTPGALPRAEVMSRERWWSLPPHELRNDVVVCGCGGGAAVREALPPLLAHTTRLVLDADALNAVAAEPTLRRLLAARGADAARSTVITPHPLEAARLLDSTTADVQRDRLKAARALAAAWGATVVLKGSGTVIADDRGVPLINPTGNASLASAGTGDVLAGWIGGLWAQAPGRAPMAVAADAVWCHGAAADRFVAQRQGGVAGPLRARDLIEAMARGA